MEQTTDNSEKLGNLIKKARIIINETLAYCNELLEDEKYAEYQDLMKRASLTSRFCLEYIKKSPVDFEVMREFLDNYYYILLNIIKEIFVKIIVLSDTNYFSMEMWRQRNKITLFYSDYILMNQNFRFLKDIISAHFIASYKASYELIVDEDSPLFSVMDMTYLEFPSDMNNIRSASRNIMKDIRLSNPHFSLTILEGQISEIIKNAVKHGNRCDPGKKVKIWYFCDGKVFRIIVEDEGEGFKNFDEWNEFNRKRNEALKSGNIEEMLKYVQYKGARSTDEDGGNSLFAALEYWDSSLVYNSKKNKVAALKYIY